MKREEINKILSELNRSCGRNIVVIDYGNVEKWKEGLGWKVGIKELANLVKNISYGKQYLRRFYYGSDFGRSERSLILSPWSGSILDRAKMNKFEIITKRVKYIHNPQNKHGFDKKCDLDVELAVDLIKIREDYDTIILFSGDGDLMCAVEYLKNKYNKLCYVFGARGHVGREVYDAKNSGYIRDILYAEDFEYRLNDRRFKP